MFHAPSERTRETFRWAVLLLALSATGAGAAEIVVSPDGKDANPGTKEAPFATIQRAADAAKAGDTVLIRAGAYGGFEVKNSGHADAPIAFRAAPGAKPVVKPANGAGLRIAGKSYIVVDGLAFDGAGVKGAEGISITGDDAGFNKILNCEVTRFWNTGLGIGFGPHDNVVKGCRIYDNLQCHWPRSNASSWGSGISVGKGTNRNNLIEGNFVYWNHGEGICAGGGVRGTIIRRNVVADNWNCNIYVDTGFDTIIDGNLCYLSADAKAWPAVPEHRSNGNLVGGIDIATEPGYRKAKAEGHYGITHSDVVKVTIINNIVVGTKVAVRSWPYKEGEAFDFTGWVIANNTFVNCDRGIYLRPNPNLKDITIRNNLTIQKSEDVFVYVQNGDIGPFYLSNNLYVGPGRFEWKGKRGDFAEWAQMTKETDSRVLDYAQAGSVIADPSAIPPRLWNEPSLPPAPKETFDRTLFERLAAPYRLKPGSPAIGAGAEVPQVKTDFQGIPRPQGRAWDIGADEHGGE